MKQKRRLISYCSLMAVLFLFTGCVKPVLYGPNQYMSGQERFGAIELSASKKIYVSPTIDHIPVEARKNFDPGFNPGEYTTDAFEKELTASGIEPIRTTFSFEPSFSGLKQAILDNADASENAVYLGMELLWSKSYCWSLDAKLFSADGNVMFEKRAICMMYGVNPVDPQEITYMTLRQILSDPEFRKALQS